MNMMTTQTIEPQLHNSRVAKQAFRNFTKDKKKLMLTKLADKLRINSDQIILANQQDLLNMDPTDPKIDRLRLTKDRIEDLAVSVLQVAELVDPTGKIISRTVLANGLIVDKKSVALGVVGVIYESRPNVTIDVASLCIQSGNVCLLRGGSDAWHSNNFLVNLIQEALNEVGMDPNIVQLLPVDRSLVLDLLHAVEFVDIIIPRGSHNLISFVRDNAKVPVIETGAGVCHTYVDYSADLDMAARIVANAKISRPSVCNSLDTVLVDRCIAEDFIGKLSPYFAAEKVEVFADETSYSILQKLAYEDLQQANEEDFGREFLDLICSIKVVDDLQEAIAHITRFSSKHSECIVSSNPENVSNFMETVDAAAVYVNASTRFTDGGEFGLGAEIGISTQKLHARGPFALEKLVTEKWYVYGDGQIR